MSQLARAVRREQAKPSGSLRTGIFRRMDGAFAVVSLQGRDVSIPFAGTVQPVPDAVVNVELRDGSGYLMLGPVKSPPTRGRVTVTGTTTVTVLGSDDVTYEVPFMSAYTPAVNDDVAVDWSEAGGLVRGKVSTTPVPAPAVTTAPSANGYHPSPFLASAAGYHRLASGQLILTWFPNYGTDRASAAWYGSTVADSIPDDAVILSARLHLSTRSQSYGGPKLAVIEGSGPQARVVVEEFALGHRSGWGDIPAAVVDLLKVAPRGLSTVGATDPSGGDVYNKVTDDPMSFALDVSWSVGAALAS